MTNPDAIARFNALADRSNIIQFPISTLPRLRPSTLTNDAPDDTMPS